MLGEAVIYEGLVLIRPADEGPVIRRVGKDVEGLAVFRNLRQLPGRKGLQRQSRSLAKVAACASWKRSRRLEVERVLRN